MKRQAQIVPLASEVSFLSGGTPRMSESRFWGGDIPWVSSGEMTESRISFTERRVTEEGARNSTKIVPANTVLVVVRGMSLAKEFRISISEREVTFNQDIKALKPSKKIDPWFLYYYLKSQRHAIRDSATDASHGTKKLETHVLEHWPLPLLDIPTQRAIASILSAYDDLIANNRRRIQLMEQAARLLYKEWFVHLRFPGHEHTKIHNGLPEGWVKNQVKELLAKVKRPGKIQKADYLTEGPIPCIDQSREFIGGYTDEQNAMIDELPMIVFGDHTRVLKFIDFPFACGADGTQLLAANDSKMSQEFFFFSLDAIDLSNYFYARHFKFLKDQHILRPTDILIEQFTGVARSVMKQVKVLQQQNGELAKARDLLLPQLMNGEVMV